LRFIVSYACGAANNKILPLCPLCLCGELFFLACFFVGFPYLPIITVLLNGDSIYVYARRQQDCSTFHECIFSLEWPALPVIFGYSM
ncbi:MAG: hypothetical protein KAT61_03680, partial [Gammaproteobacteria bacterium]|nr:hypothetical protein [Gammaproteobacteria bacterium]